MVTPMTSGVLFVHSAPKALAPHVEWALGTALGSPVTLEWTAGVMLESTTVSGAIDIDLAVSTGYSGVVAVDPSRHSGAGLVHGDPGSARITISSDGTLEVVHQGGESEVNPDGGC